MKVAVICFTAHGVHTAVRIREALEEKGKSGEIPKNRNLGEDEELSVRVWCAKSDFVPQAASDRDSEYRLSGEYVLSDRVELLRAPLRRWTEEVFAEYDALVFIGATGIAVRSVAPFLKSKASDPAVLCVDELGKFVIPLLSGHIGGANELAARLAGELGAVAVITTATDLNGKFAVDVFAKKNCLWISDMKLAKRISADVLDGKRIGFVSDFPVVGKIPAELELWNAQENDIMQGIIGARGAPVKTVQKQDAQTGDERVWKGNCGQDGQPEARVGQKASAEDCGICVTLNEAKQLFGQTLTLIPRIASIGVGCRKGTDFSVIEARICETLRSCGVSVHSVERLASIDLKAQEAGLRAFARKYGLEFVTYTAQELKEAQGEFSESAFVESVTGVSNVCERSAVLASCGRQESEQQETGQQEIGRQKIGQKDIRLDGRGCNTRPAHGSNDLPACCGKLIQKKTAGDGVTVALAVRDWSVEFG